MSDKIPEYMGLKTKIQALMNEPTLDKFCSSFMSVILSYTFIAIVLGVFKPEVETNYFWIAFLVIIGLFVGLFGFFYKKNDQDPRNQELKRKTDWSNTRYLLEHKHLDNIEDKIDYLPELLGEMAMLREVISTFITGLGEKIVKIEVAENPPVEVSSEVPPGVE